MLRKLIIISVFAININVFGQNQEDLDFEKQYAERFCTSRNSGNYGDFYFGCQRYIICNHGDNDIKKCPQNTLFDNSLQKCVDYIKGTCYKVCGKYDDFYEGLPEKKCEQFYRCFGGEKHNSKCPDDNVFSNVVKACMPKNLVDTVTCFDKLLPSIAAFASKSQENDLNIANDYDETISYDTLNRPMH